DLVDAAVDPLTFAVDRAAERFDLTAPEPARQATEWLLTLLAGIPQSTAGGLDVKVAKALDGLARRMRLPVQPLVRRYHQLRRSRSQRAASVRPAANAEAGAGAGRGESQAAEPTPIRPADLDPIDRELVQIILNDPGLVDVVRARVAPGAIRDERL